MLVGADRGFRPVAASGPGMLRLLEGEPSVLRLLSCNPFPKAPPKYVRARTYLYTFTHFGDRAWWKREENGTYLPAVSLR